MTHFKHNQFWFYILKMINLMLEMCDVFLKECLKYNIVILW
jgi:hypothetical protein